MPWSFPDNVPNPAKNKPERLQRICVRVANAALSDGKDDEDAIFACLAAMENAEEASLQVTGALQVEASGDGSVLYFKNAVLCRAETNGNMDTIDEEGVFEVASTLALKPIDVEHRKKDLCGSFIKGEAQGLAVSTEGYMWPDRFPDEANGVRAGTMFLSVEAAAKQAQCLTCGGVFSSAAEYCEHLTASMQERRKNGYRRLLKGLQSKGGAVTKNPAGTGTGFDPQAIYMLASLESPDHEFIAQLDAVLRKYGFRILEA